MKRAVICFFILIRLALLPAVADTRTWTGAVDTDWNNAGNWDGAVPAAGDAVVVPDTATKPFMAAGVYPATGSFLSFEAQPGAVVTCMGDVSVINPDSGGTVDVPHGIGVTINSQSALINGTLSADARGFIYNVGGFSGPGYSSRYGAGGTYGGRGGFYIETLYSSTETYGSLVQPTALGSAGYQDSGAGGGAVRLNVSGGVLTVNGVITANGTMRGSGGSIWLTCDTFAGSGTIRSVGGGGANGINWGSGGGGRVAVEYGASTFNGMISVAGGKLGNQRPGQPGTLWEPGRFPAISASVTITNSFQYFFPHDASGYIWDLNVAAGAEIYFHNFTNSVFAITNLFVTAGSTLRFDVDETGLIERSGNNRLVLSGVAVVRENSRLFGTGIESGALASLTVSDASTADFSNCTNAFPLLSVVAVTNAESSLRFGPEMSLSGLTSIFIDTNTTLWLPSGAYNLTGDLNVPAGATLYAQSDTNAANELSGGSTVAPHGAGVTFYCQNGLIHGTIDADGAGFGNTGSYRGPGYSTSYGVGGSYGGQGRGMSSVKDGKTYGVLTCPTALGSPGYTDGTALAQASRGGGAVVINAVGLLDLTGVVSANGLSTARAGGSGGSVWLSCTALQGNGTIMANGGSGGSGANWGSGGGGRVAVEYGASTFGGVISVAPGLLYDPPHGVTGAVFSCQSPVLGTAVSNNVVPWLKSEFGVSSNDVQIARTVNVWRERALEWQDVSTDASGSASVANDAVYTLNGLQANRRYWVFDNGVNLFGDGTTNSSPEGTLSFNILLNEPRTVRVELMQRGTFFMAR